MGGKQFLCGFSESFVKGERVLFSKQYFGPA
jgi:hypothetical protein